MSLWFVTPAWQRYELTAVCLEQRRRVIEDLGKAGIEAHQVVVADDENLDIARSVGAHVVEAPNFDRRRNSLVGRKFNQGNAYAGEHGAEWIVQIGSDSWIDPAYFLPLVDPHLTLTSPAYCAVQSDRIAELSVAPDKLEHSAGPYVFHRSLLEPSGFRPAQDISNQTDTDTITGIEATAGPITWEVRTLHPFQYVGFRMVPMMTQYRSLGGWVVAEHMDPWPILAQYYPADLVERARVVMASQAKSEAVERARPTSAQIRYQERFRARVKARVTERRDRAMRGLR